MSKKLFIATAWNSTEFEAQSGQIRPKDMPVFDHPDILTLNAGDEAKHGNARRFLGSGQLFHPANRGPFAEGEFTGKWQAGPYDDTAIDAVMLAWHARQALKNPGPKWIVLDDEILLASAAGTNAQETCERRLVARNIAVDYARAQAPGVQFGIYGPPQHCRDRETEYVREYHVDAWFPEMYFKAKCWDKFWPAVDPHPYDLHSFETMWTNPGSQYENHTLRGMVDFWKCFRLGTGKPVYPTTWWCLDYYGPHAPYLGGRYGWDRKLVPVAIWKKLVTACFSELDGMCLWAGNRYYKTASAAAAGLTKVTFPSWNSVAIQARWKPITARLG